MYSTNRSRAIEVTGALSLVLGLIVAMLAVLAGPALGATEHCPDHNGNLNKVEATAEELNTITPAAGTQVCVKAGPYATGIVTADGSSTLTQILAANGITVGQDNTPDVSYYVTYPRTEPEDVQVCDVASGEIIDVSADDADNEGYAPIDDPACGDVEPQTVPVCVVATGEIIEVDEDDADNEGYASVDDPACGDVEPETVEVCELATGNIIEVDEDQADNEGYASVDDPACEDVLNLVEERDPDPAGETDDEDQLPATEVKGEQVASGELPNTGSEHVILGLLAGGFLMLGGAMLLLGDRRRGVLA